MKRIFTLLVAVMTAMSSVFGQGMAFADEDAGIQAVPLNGEDNSGEWKIAFNLVNPYDTAITVLANRVDNNMFTGHGTYFCWDLCYDSTANTSIDPVTIQPKDTTPFFAQYIVFRPNEIVGFSTVKMAFTNISSGETIERTYQFSVGGAMSITPAERARLLSSPYPNPAKDRVQVDFELPSGTLEGDLKVYNLIGKQVMEQPLRQTSGTVTLNVEQLHSGVYFLYLNTADGNLTSQKLIIAK
ncbi:T9SS type A sorting domain-containing protein [Pontibacter sp. G13]|uniref:T9SS type A sorting domain-containing protein n=1 Tax=Pontibacter sp. G13 TaxID=3074898 RepID=UPI00288C5AFF|nr:T9SS type A sorting domain-containing protein [Pontibacter sp. G13]WNJ20718.1 T9SS type A sorting domain-containing protein [Pontibacter sp. G13]